MDSWQFVLIAVPPLCVVKISLFASQTHVALKQLSSCCCVVKLKKNELKLH